MRDDVEASLQATASRLERDMAELAAGWSAVAAVDRAAMPARLERSSPAVVRLLCPDYGRFARH